MVRIDDTMDEIERIKMLTSQSDFGKPLNSQIPRLTFKFFKNQEIPEFFYDLKSNKYLKQPLEAAKSEDYVDFNITLIDNGDDKLCLQVSLNEKKTLNLVCQMFIPVFDLTKILFAGSGHATYLKDLKIE